MKPFDFELGNKITALCQDCMTGGYYTRLKEKIERIEKQLQKLKKKKRKK